MGTHAKKNADGKKNEKANIRVGYLPNLSHAQILVGLANAAFQKDLGENVRLQSFDFKAGPSAMEALLAEAIDIVYVGPVPAINAFVKTQGKVQIVSGVASGGARLIVREGAQIQKDADFHGKKLSTPQLGNTQDLAARDWLNKKSLKAQQKGGDVQLLAIQNADQLALFQKGELDASWAPEPWATRLIHEGHGREYLDERSLWPDRKFATTVLIVSEKFRRAHPDLLKTWIGTHVDLTLWIQQHPGEAKKIINQQLEKLTGKALKENILNEAFAAVDLTLDPIQASLEKYAQLSQANGFLGSREPDLQKLVDLSILNEVLKEKKLTALIKGK